MNGFNASELVGKQVQFVYEGNERMVEVEKVNECKNGATLITGKDMDKNMAYRSFNVNKVSQLTII